MVEKAASASLLTLRSDPKQRRLLGPVLAWRAFEPRLREELPTARDERYQRIRIRARLRRGRTAGGRGELQGLLERCFHAVKQLVDARLQARVKVLSKRVQELEAAGGKATKEAAHE